ncbi:unannotated protein [freshwater metagenome]|uniref:Unannotated protein n=1 Tax=freshwater metagenome TaxID=449393 RepID=A0A6J7BJJ6_9ZZZZ
MRLIVPEAGLVATRPVTPAGGAVGKIEVMVGAASTVTCASFVVYTGVIRKTETVPFVSPATVKYCVVLQVSVEYPVPLYQSPQ